MKTVFGAFACLGFAACLHAETWTVDNNTAHPADFRTIQAAIDAAAVGDTILVAGSGTAYSGFTSTKRLNIKGKPTDTISLGVTIGNPITLTEYRDVQSPDHLRNAGGSILEGLSGNHGVSVEFMCAGVTIRRCSFESIVLRGCSGGMVAGCHLDRAIVTGGAHPSGYTVNGSSNTIVGTWAREVSNSWAHGTSIENCVFGKYVGAASQPHGGPLNTDTLTNPFLVKNTIFIGKDSIFLTTASNRSMANFDHCVAISNSAIPSENGSITLPYTNYPNVFVDATPYVSSAPPAEAFVLKAGSPAIGAGVGGVDAGMYAGIAPFVPNRVPALPRITRLAVPPLVPDSTGLTFEVDAEARD